MDKGSGTMTCQGKQMSKTRASRSGRISPHGASEASGSPRQNHGAQSMLLDATGFSQGGARSFGACRASAEPKPLRLVVVGFP